MKKWVENRATGNVKMRSPVKISATSTDALSATCDDDFDPNSLPLDQALARIRQSIQSVTQVEHIAVRDGFKTSSCRGHYFTRKRTS